MALRAFRHLVEERTGLAIAAERQADLVAAVRAGICETQCADARAFFSKLELDGEQGPLIGQLAARMLPQETYFLRDRSQLELLRREILVPLRQRMRPGQSARLWSAGCSTGEEAWSLAFMAQEELGAAGLAFEVIGTDLQPESLVRASSAVYREWSFRGLSDADRARWFEPRGDGMAVRGEFRGKVHFYQHDLQCPPAESWLQSGFDLILCRNVFIYYQPAVVRATMDRFAAALRPEGGLVIGHNEAGSYVPGGMRAQMLADSALFRNGAAVRGPSMPPPLFANPQGPALLSRPFSQPPARPQPPDPLLHLGVQATLAEARRQSARSLELGDAAGAKLYAERGLALQPGDPHLMLVIAQAEANLGQIVRAEALVSQGLAQNPMSADFHFLRYLLVAERGESKAALAILEKLRYLAPGFAAAHVHRARMYEDAGAVVPAAESWQLARQALERMDANAPVPWFESISAAELLSEVEAACTKQSLSAGRHRGGQ